MPFCQVNDINIKQYSKQEDPFIVTVLSHSNKTQIVMLLLSVCFTSQASTVTTVYVRSTNVSLEKRHRSDAARCYFQSQTHSVKALNG